MRKLALLAIIQAVCAAPACGDCPAPIPPLPQLPVPAVVPPPVETCPTPVPATVTGYLPFTFINNSGYSASDVYICVLINSSTQYLSFSGSPHKLATIADFTPSTFISSSLYSYPLSFFELIDTDTYTFYIPNDGNNGNPNSNAMLSSRILISIGQPLTYFIDNLGVLQFPAEVDPTNDNYYILNDKIEFDLGSNALNRMNLNLTGVDFFGLPLLVQANYKFFYGSSFTDACAVTGLPATIGFSDVFSQYSTQLDSLPSSFKQYWGGLVATYTNPASGGGGLCNLRIFSPATAMGSTQSQTNPSPVSFPTNYFLSSVSSPNSCTWFDAVWSSQAQSGKLAYYQIRKPTPYLILDATTESGTAIATGYETTDNNFSFAISGGPDTGKTLVFPYPTSSKAFFTGAVSDYQPAIVSPTSAATQAQVFKVFATSIISGLLPINCQQSVPIVIDSNFVQNNSSAYFENNPLLVQELGGCSCVGNTPWYDFYSRSLLTIGSPNLFYTSAYSDFLGTDGTIVMVNPATDNAAATITVTLGDCSTGVILPDPYSDTTVYNITVGLPQNVTVEFGTSAGGSFGSIPSTAAGNAFFLKVTYLEGVYNGQSFVTQIAPAAKLFHPILPGQGVITTTGSNTTVIIGASPGVNP